MPPNKQKFNAWTMPEMAKKLKSIPLPDKIRCDRCKKLKPPAQFANKRLQELQFKIFNYGPQHTSKVGTGILCRGCTGDQVTELECIICEEWKELDEFAKAQRSKPDNARCLKCMEKHLQISPGDIADQYLQSDSDDEDNDDSDHEDDYVSTAGVSLTMSTLSVSGAGPATSNKNGWTAEPDEDGWVEQPRRSHASAYESSRGQASYPASAPSAVSSTARSDTTAASANNGFDPTKYSKPANGFDPSKYGKPAARSMVNSSYARSEVSTVTTKGGWAKPNKPKPKRLEFDSDEETESVTSRPITVNDDDDDDDYW